MKLIRRFAPIFILGLLAIVAAEIISREALSNFFQPSSLAAQLSDGAIRSNEQSKEPNAKASTRIGQSYGKLPMRFESHYDQNNSRVKFIVRGSGYSLFLTDNEAVMRLRKKSAGSPNEDLGSGSTEFTIPNSASLKPKLEFQNTQTATLRMKLVGANRDSRVSGDERLQSKSSYFYGADPKKWRTNVANFGRVRYEAVYPGIDLVWYGDQRRLEHDFIVAPGADSKRIKLSFAGADSISIDKDGAVNMRLGDDAARLLKPIVWQEENGERRNVECRYKINRSNQVEFQIGDYDRRRTLVIDPVLAYSTYIGGSGLDQTADIAIDNDGFAYITGLTDSTDFPGSNPIQPARGAQTDVFVLKLNQAGDSVIYGAWLGGDGNEGGVEIAVDPTGAATITGSTTSDNFPTKNALQPVKKGTTDAFVAKLNPAGNDLIYSTYLGGSLVDNANALAVDANGNAYLTGITDSIDFPLKGAFQNARNDSSFYISADAGADWKASNQGLLASRVYDIAIDPTNPATIYAATDRGVFKSVNRGGSWSRIGATFNPVVFQLVIDPTATANLYALTQTFIYKSSDGGATWSPIQLFQGVQTIAISPTAPGPTIFVATTTGFFKSLNGGASWIQVNLSTIGAFTPRVFSIAVDPTSPAIIYAGSINCVYRSADGGMTWAPMSNGFPQVPFFSASHLATSKSNPATLLAEVFDESAKAYKTINGGADWAAVGFPSLPNGQLIFAIDPVDSNRIYAGTLGFGIYKSEDGGGKCDRLPQPLGQKRVAAFRRKEAAGARNTGGQRPDAVDRWRAADVGRFNVIGPTSARRMRATR